MVQLIPDILSPEIKSSAEKRLFIEFRDCQTDRKCIILHSLGIAEHTNNIFGEIDFVVICNEGAIRYHRIQRREETGRGFAAAHQVAAHRRQFLQGGKEK